MIGCSTTMPIQAARVYKEPGFVKPGTYRLRFLLDGRESLADYLLREKARRSELAEFDVPGLLKLFNNAFPSLFLPVQPSVPLCNLDTHFQHCRGIELAVDFDMYQDDTLVLHSELLYHITLRLEGDQPNFFRAAKAQRDRGEFALPRRFYVGALVEAIQKALPILQEIATDYRKYIKNDRQEIVIDLILQEMPERAAAIQEESLMKDGSDLGSGVLLSALPNLPFLAGLTVSALRTGGRTFWEVLQEEKQFDLCRKSLELDEVGFSYRESIGRNFPQFLRNTDAPSDILIREIIIRLQPKERNLTTVGGGPRPASLPANPPAAGPLFQSVAVLPRRSRHMRIP
jgi:hypothetical protein